MKFSDLGTTVKWQKTDPRDVPDIRDKIVNEVDFHPGTILEIGCAAGNFYDSFSLSSRYNNQYFGIDVDGQQIKKAKEKHPQANFIHGDVLEHYKLLNDCKTIISFQVLEHIEKDLELFFKIPPRKRLIFSVPNFPYRGKFPDGHKRWYELEGWINRYKDFVNFNEAWTIKHYKKSNKIFVLQGVRR